MNTVWIILPIILAYTIIQWSWVFFQLLKNDPRKVIASSQNTLRGTGITSDKTYDSATYTVRHVLEDGIERITYTPKNRKHATPILMAHGMWHGAWCWECWQELFAGWGWESIAISLPGHGLSPVQRPLRECTLDYYLSFVRDEIERLPHKPILMGHSMGGAVAQWYLKYCDQTKIAAAALIAPWVADSAMKDGMPLFFKLDPLGCMLMMLTWDARPLVRDPHVAARALISDEATLPPEELFERLGSESALAAIQHNPPLWRPADQINIPMLIAAGEKDAVVSVNGLRNTANHYNAHIITVSAAHNLMMEKNYKETAGQIRDWLEMQNLS
jgi:pimeloyl-ACP methyl ester carboxylesterase